MKNKLNNERIRSLARIAFVLMLSSTQSWADAPSLLHQLFQDHAVLQRDKPIAVWGDAAAGENVTITLADQTAVVTAD
ncbi:MAG: hypothetical protein ACJ8MR_20785, partial [Povalibacter sp.]